MRKENRDNEIFREVKRSDVFAQSTFSPIRDLILLDDAKWEILENDNSLNTLGAIERLFSINEIYPSGLDGAFKNELGLFLAQLDTFQVTLSFLSSITIERPVLNILNEIRMAIQNFSMLLDMKSYYSAFQNFRKMLEGVLWIDYIKNDFKNIPDTITTREYSKKLSEINPVLGDAYSKFNSLFHYKNATPYLNINKFYNKEDDLYDFLTIIDDCANIIHDSYNTIFDEIENKSINRYRILVNKLESARDTYSLSNHPIAPSYGSKLPIKYQTKFEDHNNIKKMSMFLRADFINNYRIGLKELSHMALSKGIFTHKITLSFQYLSLYTDELQKYITSLTPKILELNREFSLMNFHSKETKKILILYKNTCESLLKYELDSQGNVDAALIKSLYEDLIANEGIGKTLNFDLLRLIRDFLEVKYKVKISKWDTYKFSHLLVGERIKYNNDEMSDQEHENQKENYKKYIYILKELDTIIASLILNKKI